MSSSIRISRDIDGDDDYYMNKMKEILEEFPNGNPPQHPGKLLDHVYIGNQDNAEDYDLLPALGITHVLNCAGTRTFDLTKSRYPPKLGITGFLMLPAEDFEEFDIMQFFTDAISFLDKAKASGGRALVHCNLGVNRSGAICAAYLMVSQRKPLLKVIADLKSKRSVVLCNVGFRRQLLKYARARGLLDPVEEAPKLPQKKEEESSKFREYRHKYLSDSENDSKTKDQVDGTTRSEVMNGESEESFVRNGWNDETKNNVLSTEAYKSTNTKSYLPTYGSSNHDWLLDDDLDDLDSFKFSTYKTKPSTSASRVLMSQYASSNGHDSIDKPRASTTSSSSASSYSSYNISDKNEPSTYNTSSASRVSESYASSVPVLTRTRDIPQTHPITTLSSDSQKLNSSRLLDVDDIKSISTPITDNYQYSRSTSDRKSWSIPLDLTEAAERISEGSDYNSFNTDVTSSTSTKGNYSKYVEKSPITNGIDSLLFVDTTPSTHPLLVKPLKFATSAADAFKTTLKPRSYYHRKVIGRVPKYSDIDDTFLNDFNSHSFNGDRDYTSSRSSYMPDEDYARTSRISNASGKLILNDITYQPRGYDDADYILENLAKAPKSSSHLSTSSYESYRAPATRDYHRSSSVGRVGVSYRPNYSSRTGYMKNLDDDIEAFNEATLSMPSTSRTGSNIRIRAVAPPSLSSYSRLPVYI